MTTCPHTIGVLAQRDLYLVEAIAGVDRGVERVVGIFTATDALALLARAMS